MTQPHDAIVISGAGLVTSLGLDASAAWDAVLAGRCGVGPSHALEQKPSPDNGSGDAPPLPESFHPALPREARYLRWAIDDALRDAALTNGPTPWPYPPHRCGIVLGTTLHGMRAAGRFVRDDDAEPLRHFLAQSTCALATRGLPLAGYAATTCAACASGLVSLSLAITLLRRGELDLVVAGGYDPVSEYAYGGFNSLRLIAEGPQKPFARNRAGLKLAEGYGIVILERATDVATRGHTPLARLLACTGTADAHHLSQPHPEGVGAAAAMADALREARIAPADLGLIVAHATATPDNDRAEYLALQRSLGDALPSIPVTALKSHLGHTLGGAGAVELILAIHALQQRLAPPLANVNADDLEFPGLRVITGKPQALSHPTALINSLGFGGSNACLILTTDTEPAATSALFTETTHAATPAPSPSPRNGAREDEVVITGIGILLPGAVGNAAYRDRIQQPRNPIRQDTGTIDEDQVLALLNTRRVRRMSEYVKLTLAATTLACRDAGVEPPLDHPNRRWAAILSTTHGSARFSGDYYRQIVEEGIDSANPLLFAEGVPNAGSAHLSMMLGLRGPCQTLIGSRTAGLDAVHLAAARIATGEADAVIVGAAEEFAPFINRAFSHCGLYAKASAALPFGEGGFCTGAGAVSLILERRGDAGRRGVRPWGTLGRGAQSVWDPDSPTHAPRQIALALESCGHSPAVVSSAHGTWIDRLEAAAMALDARHAAAGDPARATTITSLAGYTAESFAVTPLLGLLTPLLAGLPRLHSDPGVRLPEPLRPAGQDEQPAVWRTLASDYNGLTTVLACHAEPIPRTIADSPGGQAPA